MKIIKNILYGLSILSLALFYSCGSDDPSPLEDATNKLAKTWGNATVILDGADVTSPSYSDFSITFRADGSYTTSDGDPAFKSTGGFWAFTNQSTFTSILVDGVTMSVVLNEEATTLKLSFLAPGAPVGARVSGLVGDYIFDLQAL
ncbi:MAG: hypothetical protein HC819_12980 [Cyclobacteriaceae bacterium]|nr:hypothetical protein [Cyclobacteriaceae bacterium]